LKWRTKTKGLVRSSPCVYEGAVYVGSFDGFIYSLKTDDGSELWKFNTRGSDYMHVQPSPKISNGILYCGSRNPYFYAIDAKTGKEIWKYSYSGAWVESSAAINDSIVYVGSSDIKKVYAFKAKTGKVFWSLSAGGYPWSSPCYNDGAIYIGLGNFGSTMKTKTSDALIAIDAATGKQIWKLDCGQSMFLGGVVSSPIVNNSTVYYGSLDGKVYAVSTVITAIENNRGDINIPNGYKIGSYPNPFNPETKIQFSIPESKKVNLSIFDSLGRMVKELMDKDLQKGTYEIAFNAGSLSGGIYYSVLRTGDVMKVCKTIYLP
jgi:outer membrane protein assembly factor BamB